MHDTDRARAALHSIPPDLAREEWHAVGRAAIAAGLTVDDVDEWSTPAENYSGRRDVLAAFRTIKPEGGTGAGTLFHYAKEYGYSSTETARPAQPVNRPPKSPHRPAKQPAHATPSDIWARCVAADAADAYIDRKQGKPDGLRLYPATAEPLIIRQQNMAGYLAVPCWDGADLQTLQFIPPDGGDKLNLPGASFGTGFFTVGEITDRAYIVEGIGQAWAVNKATGAASVVAFGAGRMATVAKALTTKHPAARLVIVPDKGKEADAEKIAAAVAGLVVAMPEETPANYDANDLMQEHGTEALRALLESAQAPHVEPPLSVVMADELPDTFTPPDELVQGLLIDGDGSILYGDSNSGKTFFVIGIGCSLARGVPFMGRNTEPGLVVYLAAESPASVRSRLQAYQRHHRVRVPNFAIVQSPIDLFDGDADTDAVIQTVRNLENKLGKKARLIVGDTLARLSAGANENAGQDMGLVVRRIDRIRTECQAHFLLIHHSGKNAAAGARGWSGVRAAVDTEIEITDSPTGRCAEITKQRDLSTKGERIGFRLAVVPLGETKWGAPATSCVVESCDAPEKPTGKRVSEVGGAVLEMLRSKGCGVKKRDVVTHFSDQYDKSAVYRELKKLVTGGAVRETAGIVAAIGFEGGAK
jgi:KaiC/GvpD/RAD55 family RecA-like ATPase